MIYVVAFGVGLKCPRKIHLNTQCPPVLMRSGAPEYGTEPEVEVEGELEKAG